LPTFEKKILVEAGRGRNVLLPEKKGVVTQNTFDEAGLEIPSTLMSRGRGGGGSFIYRLTSGKKRSI